MNGRTGVILHWLEDFERWVVAIDSDDGETDSEIKRPGAAAGAAGSSVGVPIGSALLLAFDIEEPRHICMSLSLAKSSRCGSCCSSEYRRSQTAPATCNAQLAVSGGRNERGASKE